MRPIKSKNQHLDVFVESYNPMVHQNWVLDSRATHHMCSYRSWFDSYKPCEGLFLMENNSSSKVVGVGSINLRMFNEII